MARSRRITERQADAFLKRFFSRRPVLAALLRELAPEFRDMDVADIARNHLLPLGDSELVQICNTDGGSCRYDIVFRCLRPGHKSSRDCIVFDIEFQNKTNLGYAIIKRGIYYSSNLLCSEKGTLFEDSDYGGLRKVHGLWLCPRAPASRANSILRYNLRESVEGEAVAQAASPQDDYDLIALTVVNLNDDVPPKGDRGLRLLHALFSSAISPGERERILKEEYSINLTTEEKMMYSVFHYAMKDGKKKARREGEEIGCREGRKEGEKLGMEKGEKLGMEKGEKLGMEKGEKLGMEKGERLGLQKGIAKAYRSIVQNLLVLGKSEEEIQSLLAIPREEVTGIIDTLHIKG